MENKNWESFVIALILILGTMLVIGKATGYMDITWWEATAPFWIPFTFVTIPFMILGIVWWIYSLSLIAIYLLTNKKS